MSEHSRKEKLKAYYSALSRIDAAGRALAQAQAEEKIARLESYEIGQLVEGEGLYVGRWSPRDPLQKGLGQTFNVFAAPHDLMRPYTYDKASDRVAGISHWQGHAGEGLHSAESIRAALREKTYKGGWIIPPRELLCGSAHGELSSVITNESHLIAVLDSAERGHAFRRRDDNYDPAYYFSSTLNPSAPDKVYAVRPNDRRGGWVVRDKQAMLCRPVRLVAVTP